MIDIRKLKELVRLMVENELTELDLKDQEETVTIKRGGAGANAGMPVMLAPQGYPAPRPVVGDEEAAGEDAPPAAAPDTSGLVAIASPMVGTFYAAANPDTPAFASVGTAVSPESVVCLIEAMKVFNEIKAEVSGTIERVLVQNGTAVEFGQKLFLVRPS